MKKILLGTSAIVGASVLLASPVWAAEKPTLKMDGFLRFEAWQISQDLDSTSNRGLEFDMDDVEIHFQGSAKADNGLEYGFYVEIQEGGNDSKIGYDEANVFLAGNWGRLDLGSQDGVENNYKPGGYAVSADKDGAWDGKALLTRTGNHAFVGTDLGTGVNGGTGDANKITYYTPSFSGFTAGVSFTPDSNDQFNTGISDEVATKLENAISAAVRYQGQFSGVSVDVAVRGLKANWQANDSNTTADLEDMKVWGVGGTVGYAGFTLGASYQDLGNSGVAKSAKAVGAEAGKWYDVGVSYATGPYKVSVAYMKSTANDATTVAQQDDSIKWYSVGFDYSAAPGLDLYATYQYVDLDQTGTASDNTANMFMVGTQVSF